MPRNCIALSSYCLPSVIAVAVASTVGLLPTEASAGLGTPNANSWSWVDTKGTGGPTVVARYVTRPMRTATGTGLMSYPTLPDQTWNWTTKSPAFPLETWTVTATSATTFTVVGSVSGAQLNATLGTPYTSAAGLEFVISIGSVAFVAGDKFVFDVVDHFDLSTAPGVTTYRIPGTGFHVLPTTNMNLYAEGQGNNTLIVYEAGYLALASGNPNPLDDYNPPVTHNTALPARVLTHDNNAEILPFWDELKQKSTSKIRTLTAGRSGRRIYIVEYNDFAHADDATASYTFQVVLFENSERVRFHYIKLQNGTGMSADGSTATVGLQGRLSSRYTASSYAANTASLTEGLVIEFGRDNDRDRLPNGIELQYDTNDSSDYSDGGSPQLTDAAQLLAGIDPTDPADNATKSADTDGDTVPDVNEVAFGTNPAVADSDGDGVNDNIEIGTYDALVADTDGDGLSDGAEDADKDGTTNGGTESNPTEWDTDGDGVSDGTEVTQGTDKLDVASSRMSAAIPLGGSTAYGHATAVDSKGNLHVVWATNSQNSAPDDLYVALFKKNGATYELAVARTLIDAHVGHDDRVPTIVTAPGGSNAAVDRTIILNGSRGGFAFLTTIDFGLTPLDGTASTSATLVSSTRMLDIPVAVNHPVMKLANNKLHLVFQGQEILGTQYFQNQHIGRGTYYVQLELDGTIVVPTTTLFQKDTSAHHHNFPRIAIDTAGNVHSIVRGGTCSWTRGTSGCAFYYTKLSATGSVIIPTTQFQLEGNGAIHKSPELLVSPNGLVNVIYVTNAPMVGSSGNGGYSVGNEVRLHSFATINNQIQTVIDQKTLLSAAPDLTMGLPDNVQVNTFRTPSAVLDAGGNLHLFVVEDNNLGDGLYYAFDPSGNRKLGPYRTGNGDDQSTNAIELIGDTVLFVYKNSTPNFRELNITGSGLDLTGGSQVPLPVAEELVLTAVTPPNVASGGTAIVTASGSGFVSGTTLSIGGVALGGVTSFRPGDLTGAFDATGLADGPYDVVATNPDGTTATLSMAFYVGELPAPPSDGGCCDLGASDRSPVGSLLLVALVALGLRGRRKRRAAGAIAATNACAYIARVPPPASAGLGTRSNGGWAWTDSKTGAPIVVPRYTTVPVRTATGNGTMNQPVLPAQLWNWTTNAAVLPVETWTVTATSATNFTVVGSVSGAQAAATVNASYTSAAGLNFTIASGGTPFVAGDKFEFQVVDRLDPQTLPGAVSAAIPGNMLILSAPFAARTEGRADSGVIVYGAGYLAVTYGNPRFLDYFGPQQLPNTALPARTLAHDRAVTVMPFWDELKAKPTSKIWTATQGRSGSRIFIVEYNDFAHQTDPTASYTFQVLFYENLDRLRFHYIKLQNGSGTSANGSTATVGIQGFLNNYYSAPGYSANTASLMEGQVIEFGVDNDADRIPSGIEAQYGTSDGTRYSEGGSPQLSDPAQLVAGIDPTNVSDNSTRATDTDGDTVLDVEEAIYGTNPALVDTDGDGLNDNLEIGNTDPLVADTDGDGLSDGTEDADKNGGQDSTESSPTNWDTDGDGINDGAETALGTDKLLDTSSRFLDQLELGVDQVRGLSAALDSKGNLHVAWTERTSDNATPDDLFVALLTPKDGKYQLAVAPTVIDLHVGMDDRTPTITTVPGAAGSTVDLTVMVNNSRAGYAFYTQLDFGLAARDGTATMPLTIVTASRMLDFPLAMNHPHVKVAANRVHVVFQGQGVLDAEFNNTHIDRGAYYVQLDLAGTVVVPPMELFHKTIPSHHHTFPRVAVDATGNVHTVLRGGDCRWEVGTGGCAFYYTKLASTGTVMIPTTMLQLRGNGGIHKYPELLVSPNGLVNLIYTTVSPLVGAAGGGGYSVGNEVQLHSFSTVNNRITTVIDQKPLMSVIPDLSQGLAQSLRLPAYRTPAATLDVGGNIHLLIAEDGNQSTGLYAAFDPSGARKLGPYRVQNARDGQIGDAIQVTDTKALFVYRSNGTQFRELDITGHGLDLSGESQVPLPEPDALAITAVSPATCDHRGKASVTVAGSGFVAGTTISIGGVALTEVHTFDAANALGDFDAVTLVDGVYDVVVTNPDGATATLPAAFTVGTPSTGDDGGCCETGSGTSRPAGWFLLALGVVIALRRRRRS